MRVSGDVGKVVYPPPIKLSRIQAYEDTTGLLKFRLGLDVINIMHGRVKPVIAMFGVTSVFRVLEPISTTHAG